MVQGRIPDTHTDEIRCTLLGFCYNGNTCRGYIYVNFTGYGIYETYMQKCK